jgi:hypothetical protein
MLARLLRRRPRRHDRQRIGIPDNRMIDENADHLHARRNNVRRYRRLLQTELTELARQYIERRLNEEKSAMESLTSSPQQF